MKKIIHLILLTILFSSCEEVINVDLETAPPRLVVEASINWVKETSGKSQQIKLSTTAPYFDTEIPPVNNAEVYITDEEGNQFNFDEEEKTGIYYTENFIPQLNKKYFLTITVNGETYTAEETLLPVSDIKYVTQQNNTIFSEEYVELKAYFNDPTDEENFYFYSFYAENDNTSNAQEDRLVNGNEMFVYFNSNDLFPEDKVEIKLYGVSERFFTYINTLLSQTGESGGPFQTQPATVRGNIINTTNPDNFAFGYFRLSETDTFTYTIE